MWGGVMIRGEHSVLTIGARRMERGNGDSLSSANDKAGRREDDQGIYL
jgi:hypothetical protein